MSLSSALFSGTSGLTTMGNAMTVIGDNIANVNTVGFKGSRVTFQDVLSQTVSTSSGTAQVGQGTSMAGITQSFCQGSMESTDSATDLAVSGNGFFILGDPNSDKAYYSRAGEFRFDKNGNFTNPAGLIVRGWKINPDTGQDEGALQDIKLNSFTSPPETTKKIGIMTNLNAQSTSKTYESGKEAEIALVNLWDGTDANTGSPLDGSNYEYRTTVKAYDSLGATHDVTLYFDRTRTTGQWEFLVTCNPDEDRRVYDTSGTATDYAFTDTARKDTIQTQNKLYADATQTAAITSATTWDSIYDATGAAAALVNGDVITFSGTKSDGTAVGATNYTITDITADTVDGLLTAIDTAFAGDATASIDSNGRLVVTGADGGDSDLAFTISGPGGRNLDFGASQTIVQGLTGGAKGLLAKGTILFDETSGKIKSSGLTMERFEEDGTTAGWVALQEADFDDYFTFKANFLGGLDTEQEIKLDLGVFLQGTSWEADSLTTTQYQATSSTIFQSADGYGAGDLESTVVDSDGVITGHYSNGQVLELYRVGLANFNNVQALHKVGGNLYRETRNSGTAITGKPGTNSLGSITPNALEQSNVDLAGEFVKMITTQRGFQANSKVITVTDQMLQELINLKR